VRLLVVNTRHLHEAVMYMRVLSNKVKDQAEFIMQNLEVTTRRNTNENIL